MCHIGWDDDGPAFWAEKTRRARKAYRCECCGTVVAPGDQYLVTTYASERGDRPSTMRSCLPCAEIAETFGLEHEGKPFPRSLRSFLADCIAEGDEESQRWKPMLDQIDARRAAAEARS